MVNKSGTRTLDLRDYIRSVPDFPKPGITFYDITTLLHDPVAFRETLDRMEEYVHGCKPHRIVAIESRGFMFGAALADRLNIGIVPARKPGKLPYDTIAEKYSLEYGTDEMEMHIDAVYKDERIVIVDDLIATGGTLLAVCKLVERLGGNVAGVSAVVELSFLPWRELMKGYDVNYLISYDSE